MPVETPADRASMFDDDEFGTVAAYIAPGGGDPIVCTIIHEMGRKSPFELGGDTGSGLRSVRTWEGALLLADQVPFAEIGGDITPGSRDAHGNFVAGPITYRIVSRPLLDETGAVWTMDLARS